METKVMGSGAIVLLILAILSWAILMVNLSNVVGVDAPGDRGMGKAITWFVTLAFLALTWLFLGGLLLTAGGQDMLPPWVGAAATLLWPLSGAAAIAALFLVDDPKVRWPALIPILIPPLTAAYVFAVYRPSLRVLFQAPPVAITVWGAILFLSLAPWPAVFHKQEERAARQTDQAREQEEWAVKEKARKRAENLPKIQEMSPSANLAEWFSLLADESGVRAEAIEALRHVERRQRDVEEILPHGISAVMRLVPDLDLKPTPELCRAARQYLLKNAAELTLGKDHQPVAYDSPGYFEQSFVGVRWFIAHGCDCSEGIDALDKAARTYLDSPLRQKLLAELAALRPAH